METFSALLALCAGNSPVIGEFPSERASDAELWCLFLICAWIKDWVNNREVGDLKRYRTHYDVTVMDDPPTGFIQADSKLYYFDVLSSETTGELAKPVYTRRRISRQHIAGRTITVYPRKYAHGFCFVVLCCGYTLTDFPISIRLTSLALWQSNDCPSASKATLMNMDKYFMWIHYERLHNHNKAKHNKTVCIFVGIYCILGAVSI